MLTIRRLAATFAACAVLVTAATAPATAASPYIGVFSTHSGDVDISVSDHDSINEFEVVTACEYADFFFRHGLKVNKHGKFSARGTQHGESYSIHGVVKTNKKMLGRVKVVTTGCGTFEANFIARWHQGPPA